MENSKYFNKIYFFKNNDIKEMRDLDKFTMEILNMMEINVIDRQKYIDVENFSFAPDFIIEEENKKYLIDVKSSFDLDTIKTKTFKHNFNAIKRAGYENIVFVYDKVRPIMYERLENSVTILDISNILYIIKDNNYLLDKLMGILNYTISGIKPVKPKNNIQFIKPINSNKKSTFKNFSLEYFDFINRLESLPCGKKFYNMYQTFCIDVLKYLFLDDLGLWQSQSKTDKGLNIFDLICKIKNNVDCEFFSILDNYFNSKYIIFEFKNYSDKINQEEIITTQKYLYSKALRNVAIIFSRKGIDNNGIECIKGILREEGKLILNFDDDDIINMISLKIEGQDPSVILMNKLDTLLTHLDK